MLASTTLGQRDKHKYYAIFIFVVYTQHSMKEEEEDNNQKKVLTAEQIKELMSYPQHWRPTLREAAERGESIKETYEELKDFEGLM